MASTLSAVPAQHEREKDSGENHRVMGWRPGVGGGGGGGGVGGGRDRDRETDRDRERQDGN